MNYLKLSGWGKNTNKKCKVIFPKNTFELKNIKETRIISRGMGRSYGDSSFLEETTVSMIKFNKILLFNKKTGIIKCQSGCTIDQILKVIMPEGWFMPVTPGTKFVTIGGILASNVHGKNHHKVGTFKNFVKNFKIILSNKKEVICSRKKNSEIFNLTIGGMGLTGIITEVEFSLLKINSNLIEQKKYFTKNIKDLLNIHKKLDYNDYLVSWINCSKNNLKQNAITFAGNHYSPKDKQNILLKKKYKISVPFFGINLMNRYSIKLLSLFYFYSNYYSKKETLVDILDFFYPLDKFLNWNNVYGKNGFFQIQFVVPSNNSEDILQNVMNILINKSDGSFITVIKKMKNELNNYNKFSFSKEGTTFAVDLSENKKNLVCYKLIEDIILRNNGKIYLAKDSQIKKNEFDMMFGIKYLNKIENQYSSSYYKFTSEQMERFKKN